MISIPGQGDHHTARNMEKAGYEQGGGVLQEVQA